SSAHHSESAREPDWDTGTAKRVRHRHVLGSASAGRICSYDYSHTWSGQYHSAAHVSSTIGSAFARVRSGRAQCQHDQSWWSANYYSDAHGSGGGPQLLLIRIDRSLYFANVAHVENVVAEAVSRQKEI